MRWQVGDDVFDLDDHFEVLKYLGSGAYGVVCSAFDRKERVEVAIKKCKRVFSSKVIAKRTLRELRILKSLSHPNIIQIRNVHYPMNPDSFEEIYMIFELMETDLSSIIKSRQVLSNSHIQLFMYQLVKGCDFLHSHSILHRDIKPKNILVNSNCLLKLADFGLAKIVHIGNSEKIAPMTEYVTSRWYRAPEILVGFDNYDGSVDMWSCGVIMYELLYRSTPFPGSHALHQMDLIISKLGVPSLEFIESCHRSNFRHMLRDKYLSQVNNTESTSLEAIFECKNISSMDPFRLLKSLLVIEPSLRMSAQEALDDAYLKSFHTLQNCEKDMISEPKIMYSGKHFDFEMNSDIDIQDFKYEILKDIEQYAHASNLSEPISPMDVKEGTLNCSSYGCNKNSSQSYIFSDNITYDNIRSCRTNIQSAHTSFSSSLHPRTSLAYAKSQKPLPVLGAKKNSKSWLSWTW